MINIVGLGPGSPASLTMGTINILKNEKNLFFRTEKHPTIDFLREEGLEFKTFDSYYESEDNFDEVYRKIAHDIIEKYETIGNLVYGVPGHPLVAERSVLNLIDLCEERGIEYEICPAVSFVDAMMESLRIDPIEGLKIIDAFDMNNQILDKRIGTIITQVYNNFIASEVKLKLLEYYNDETEIVYVRAAGIKEQESIRKIPLYELDMQEDIDYLTSVYIPKDLDNKKDIYDLVNIVEKLRSENGCPWDRDQTHESIKNELIEECYEVVDAIEKEDDDALIEELGDVLLHVVFHSIIGKEDGFFDFTDIIQGICNKMIYRHPHVFNSLDVKNSDEVLQNWDELKKVEKGFDNVYEDMSGIASSLPGLVKAMKIQKKASKVGFDWDDVSEAIIKVKEELDEILEVYKSKNMEIIRSEVGDLLFAAVNVARMLNINPEEAINVTNKKFIIRFKFIEENLASEGKKFGEVTLEYMDKLWEKAKQLEKNN